jgi:uncharacterized protein (DUF427 family)
MANDNAIESVWDYPRPPRVERTARTLKISHGGILLAETRNAVRILETSHPPVYYIPIADIAMQWMQRSNRRQSFCEWKGQASYWNIAITGHESHDAAWSYSSPVAAYAELRDHLAFYASKVDECSVDGEIVVPQSGDFYGGWITSHVKGPFKGTPGTMGW